MQSWLSEQARLYALILLCALLWTLESVVPLYRYGKRRLPHAFPNVVLALWDGLRGTYTPRIDFGGLRYGLDGFDDRRRQSPAGLLTMPFVKFK